MSELFSWSTLAFGGGIVASVGLFWQNVLSVRKLHLENRLLRERLEKDQASEILVPTKEQISAYGTGRIRERDRSSIGRSQSLLLLIVVGVLTSLALRSVVGDAERNQLLERLADSEMQAEEYASTMDQLVFQLQASSKPAAIPGSSRGSEMQVLSGIRFISRNCMLRAGGVSCGLVVESLGAKRRLVVLPATQIVDASGRAWALDSGSNLGVVDLLEGVPTELSLDFTVNRALEGVKLLSIRTRDGEVRFRNLSIENE